MFAIRQNRNNEVVYRKVKDLESLIEEGIRQGFLELMRMLKREANRAILKDAKTGRVYIRRDRAGRRRRHQSSAPGETHANRTGALRRSVSFKVHGYDRAKFGYGAVGDAPVYARFVEFGTSKMRARPSLQNAITKVDAEDAFERGLSRMLKGVVRR